MLVDKKDQDRLQKLIDKTVSIEGRVAMLVESLTGIDPHSALNDILESVVSEDRIAKAAYKDLCETIKGELFILLNQINEKKVASLKIDLELHSKEKEQNRYCSIYAKVPPLQDLQNDKEYKYFLEKYKEGTKLSQQISELSLKATNLLEVQRTLDHAFAGSMIETDYLIRRINETMRTFRYMKSADLLENYKNKYCGYKELQKMIEDKNAEFESVRKRSSRPLNQEEIASVKKENIETVNREI